MAGYSPWGHKESDTSATQLSQQLNSISNLSSVATQFLSHGQMAQEVQNLLVC